MRYSVFTDGACKNNPGPGGWAALICLSGSERLICGGEPDTTNNRMEMLAVIQAMKVLPDGSTVDVYSDSKYVVQGIQEWIPKWKQNSWLTSSFKAVKNKELWMILDEQSARLDVAWHWVKGHSGHRENDIVDQAAQCAAEKYRSQPTA